MDNSDKTRTSSHDSWVVWDLNGYLDGISLIKNEMANVEPEESAKHYFFRGQASYDWNVMPGIFRNGMLAHEYDKLAFNLTKRQLVCFSSAAAVGLPAYLFSRGSIGNSAAMFLMIGLMLPFFFLAMYERDGLPLEKVLKNIIRTRFLYPRVRPYKTENFYALLSARKEAQPIAKQQKGRKARRQKA